MPETQISPDAYADDSPRDIRPRSLSQAGLNGPELEVYKHDARSRVWRVDHETHGPVVVKRFEYRPLRQRLSLIVGIHPGACELRRNQQLGEAQVPVVPILDAGEQRDGMGGRVWLATPVMGTSLQRRLTGAEVDQTQAKRWVDAASDLARALLGAGFTFKDFKPSNVIITDTGDAMLIDVGCARPDTSAKQVTRMLAVMDRVMKRDGLSRELRERFRKRVDQPT